MPTALFTKARTAGLLALTLTLTIATSALAPAQAASFLSQKSSSDLSSSHDDCISRRELKYELQSDYHYKQIDVQKTHDYYIYKVSALAPAKMAAESLVLKDKSSDYTRYVFLFDACDEAIIEWIKPSHEPAEMK
jgi:hypothetical protein